MISLAFGVRQEVMNRPHLFGVRQEVMNRLHLLNTRRWNAALGEFGEPVTFDSGSSGNLSLAKRRLIYQLICTFQQVHRLSLAKLSPASKENLPQANCDNGSACQNTPHMIMSRRGWPHSVGLLAD